MYRVKYLFKCFFYVSLPHSLLQPLYYLTAFSYTSSKFQPQGLSTSYFLYLECLFPRYARGSPFLLGLYSIVIFSVRLSLTTLCNMVPLVQYSLHPFLHILSPSILYLWLISFIVCLPPVECKFHEGRDSFLSVLIPAKSPEPRTMFDT